VKVIDKLEVLGEEKENTKLSEELGFEVVSQSFGSRVGENCKAQA